ncbi:hypothetical protein NDU88_004687 [Pleurodeles waltl]|uniref:Uncharacterized protein n=1 Tax=Pleurodeles waltl TaxID=8319 RepID=A0AAV7WVU3_PLEWA|nr:hypothetical protein NDU88_004687 [Pleurodeles waltl]
MPTRKEDGQRTRRRTRKTPECGRETMDGRKGPRCRAKREGKMRTLETACQENIANAWWDEAPFGTTEIEARPLRKKLSRKEKREQQQEYRDHLPPETPEPVPQTGTVLTITGTFR